MSNVLKMLSRGGAAAAETDPNFKQTVLLLHGDGTNGAQNNTFLDGSTNNFTITRNGNTTQGTFSPFSVGAGEWSNYFDGTANGFLSTPPTTDLDLSGNFTLQAWIYPVADSQAQGSEILSRGATTTLNGWHWYYYNNKLNFGFNYAGFLGANNTTISKHAWTHVALTRSGNTFTYYLNGVADGTFTSSATPTTNVNDVVYVGRGSYDTTNRQFPGYMSNVSVIKGTALTTFNVTTPLSTSTSNQSLLTCTSNRFFDANTATTAKTLTAGSGVRVTPFSPFAPSAAYDPAVNGGSGYFDGTGDYLSIADNAAFELGSSNFAIEAWVYPLALPGNNAIANVASQYITTGSRSFLFALYNNAGTMQLLFQPVSGSTDTAISQNFAFKIGEWAHIAAVRSGNNITLYGNGVSLGTTAYSSTINNATGSYLVGARFNASSVAELLFNGYIAGHRLIVGSDTAPSGIPTAPPTNVTNTSLLLNFTNAGIFDNTGKNNLETVGNAQIDTTTKKYGTGSMEFDGTGDVLVFPQSENLSMGSGDFTYEFWINPTDNTAICIFDTRTANNNTTGFTLLLNGSSNLAIYTSSTILTCSGTISTGVWTHVAVVRSGTTLTVYSGGSSVGSVTFSNNLTDRSFRVGEYVDGTGDFTGFIDDLRITKGVARYTANFTAPTKAFPDQ